MMSEPGCQRHHDSTPAVTLGYRRSDTILRLSARLDNAVRLPHRNLANVCVAHR